MRRIDYRDSTEIQRQTIFSTIGRDNFKKTFSEIGQLALADAANIEKCVRRSRPDARHFAEGRVVEQDVSGHAALGGELTPEISQGFEQTGVHTPQGFFVDAGFFYLGFGLQQLDRAVSAQDFS